MLKSSQKIKNFANSNDSVLENVGLKMTLDAGGEKKKRQIGHLSATSVCVWSEHRQGTSLNVSLE